MDKVWRGIVSYWSGNEELYKAFLIAIGLRTVFFVIPNLIISRGELLLLFIVFVAVTIWSMVSVWRCASNTTIPFWFWVARIFVVINIVGWIGTIRDLLVN